MPFKFVGFNLQESLNDKIDEAAERAGVKRSEFIRNALCAAIEAQGIKILPEDLASNQGARNDLPNRITEAEKRSRKGMRPRGRSRKEEARLIKRAKTPKLFLPVLRLGRRGSGLRREFGLCRRRVQSWRLLFLRV